MIKNILLKAAMLTLILGFISNSSFATETNLNNKFLDPEGLKSTQQLIHRPSEEVQQAIFSGAILSHISSYLGRLEVGHIQQVSKSINHFFIKGNESLPLWKDYIHQLQLDITDVTKVEDLISHVKNYYKFEACPLPVFKNERFHHINFTCFDFSRSILAGFAKDMAYNDEISAIMCENGEIISLEKLNKGGRSYAKSIIVNGPDIIITGVVVVDDQNGNQETKVEWKNGKIHSLSDHHNKQSEWGKFVSADGEIEMGIQCYGKNWRLRTNVRSKRKIGSLFADIYFKQLYNKSCRLIIVSRNGSEFVAESTDDEVYYKAHLPRYDLWEMK